MLSNSSLNNYNTCHIDTYCLTTANRCDIIRYCLTKSNRYDIDIA